MNLRNWIRSYVVQVIPIISFLIYIFGFSYYIAYYGVFGINIISYITLSEVLVVSLVPIIVCIVLGLVCNVGGFIYIKTMKPYLRVPISKILPNKVRDIYKNKIEKRLHPSLKTRLRIMSQSTIMIFLLLVIYVDTVDVNMFIKRISLILCLIAIGIYEYNCIRFYRKLRLYQVRMFYYMYTSVVVGIGLVVTLVFVGISEGKTIMQSEPDYFKVIMTNGNLYETPLYTYIGDTSCAIFLYERATGNSLIINRENIIGIMSHRGKNQ